MLLVCCNKRLKIDKNPEKITEIKPFINKYKWERIIFPSEKVDWKKIEKNDVTIAPNVLYVKKEKYLPCFCFKT